MIYAAFYIWENNPNAAKHFFEKVEKQTEVLQRYPLIGKTGRIKDTRELVLVDLSYIVVYRIVQSDARILAVIHTSQKWPKKIPFT